MARQAIPRPDWARRIDPSKYAPDIADPAWDLNMGAVRRAFAARTQPAQGPVTAEQARAAVLVLLVPSCPSERSETEVASSVVLIRRASHLRANPGEIAFPGGRIEPGEAPLQAALREALEEVALEAGDVEILGELPVVHASRRSVTVLPFVAMARVLPELKACPDEVDGVLVVPLRELVAPGRYWQEQWDPAGDPAWVMHFFDLGDDVVWGATARMLYELYLRLVSLGSGGRTDAPPGGRRRPASRPTTAAS